MWKSGEAISLGMDFLQFHARMASLPLPARLDASSSLGLQIASREIPGLPPSPNKVSPPHGRASPRPDISRTASCLPTMTLNRGLNPMNLMQTANHANLKLPPYSSPPPTANNPENNICKLVEFRGAKIAAFTVESRELICLPQAFEHFLKHLVGGLHTVYTKLKRLEIIPVVCNVEQVRILRGLGAIQPGVNRCKLISCAEFETLYDDCTNSNARPGRPAKRVNSGYPSEADVLESLKRRREDIHADLSYNQRLYDRDHQMQPAPSVGGYPALSHFSNLFSMHHIMQPMALRPHINVRPARENPQTGSEITASRRSAPRSDDDILPMLGIYGPLSSGNARLPQCLPTIRQRGKPLNLLANDEKDESRAVASDDDECNVDDDIASDEDNGDKVTDDSSNSGGYSNNSNNHLTDRPSLPDMNSHLLPLIEEQRFSDFESLVNTFNTVVRSLVDAARNVERRVSEEKDQISVELEREKERCLQLEKEMLSERRKREFFQHRARRLKRGLGCESTTATFEGMEATERTSAESNSEQRALSTQVLCFDSEDKDALVTDSSFYEGGATEEKPGLRRRMLEAMNSPIRTTQACETVNVFHHAVASSPVNI